MNLRTKPLILFDGECSICREVAEKWVSASGGKLDATPFQSAQDEFPQISPQKFEEAVHLAMPDGTIYRGAEAVFKIVEDAAGRGWLMAGYRRSKLFASLAEWGYSRIAHHRILFSALIRWF